MDGQEGWSKKPKPGVMSRICRRRPDDTECRPFSKSKDDDTLSDG